MRHRALTLLIVPVITLLAACGSTATQIPAASTGAASPSTVASVAASNAVVSSAPSAAATGACAAAPAGSTAKVTITIKDFSFSPQPAQAKVGDVVAWNNADSAPHSATMDDGSCDTDTLSTGATAMLVFTAPGTYTYHCKIHPGRMKGFTVVVG